MPLTKKQATEKYLIEGKHCPECGTRISYEHRKNIFCSHSCRAKSQNRNTYPMDERLKCRQCGTIIGAVSGRFFCDGKCKSAHYAARWLLVTSETANSPWVLRLVLLRDRGHACERCGTKEWNGLPVPIEVDHINGISDDNRSDNLRLLCCNCHAQTPTYKSKNRGKGRASLAKKKRLMKLTACSSSDKETRFSGVETSV